MCSTKCALQMREKRLDLDGGAGAMRKEIAYPRRKGSCDHLDTHYPQNNERGTGGARIHKSLSAFSVSAGLAA